MSNKSRRNAGKEHKNRVSEAESKLAKMSYYWIFSVVWALLGVFLVAVGLTSGDARVEAAPAVKVGGFIIVMAVIMVIYGARMHFKLSRQASQHKRKEKKAAEHTKAQDDKGKK